MNGELGLVGILRIVKGLSRESKQMNTIMED